MSHDNNILPEKMWIIGSLAPSCVCNVAPASNHDFLMRLLFSHQPVDWWATKQNRRSSETWNASDNRVSWKLWPTSEQMVNINIMQQVYDHTASHLIYTVMWRSGLERALNFSSFLLYMNLSIFHKSHKVMHFKKRPMGKIAKLLVIEGRYSKVIVFCFVILAYKQLQDPC